MGTLVELVDPTPALTAALAERGWRLPQIVHEPRSAPRSGTTSRVHTKAGTKSSTISRAGARASFSSTSGRAASAGGVRPGLRRSALEFRPHDGAVGALERLSARARTCPCSNWDASLAGQLERAGLRRLFVTVVSSAEAGAAKLDPAVFRPALERPGTAPERTLHVGDEEADRDGAARGGPPLRACAPRYASGATGVACMSKRKRRSGLSTRAIHTPPAVRRGPGAASPKLVASTTFCRDAADFGRVMTHEYGSSTRGNAIRLVEELNAVVAAQAEALPGPRIRKAAIAAALHKDFDAGDTLLPIWLYHHRTACWSASDAGDLHRLCRRLRRCNLGPAGARSLRRDDDELGFVADRAAIAADATTAADRRQHLRLRLGLLDRSSTAPISSASRPPASERPPRRDGGRARGEPTWSRRRAPGRDRSGARPLPRLPPPTGLKTLPPAGATERKRARARPLLESNAKVKRVSTPGSRATQYELALRQLDDAGGVLAFELEGGREVRRAVHGRARAVRPRDKSRRRGHRRAPPCIHEPPAVHRRAARSSRDLAWAAPPLRRL